MKRSINILFSLMFGLLVTAQVSLQAQTESVTESRSVSISSGEGGKVTLKITTKKGDDTQTFEKTYDSQEDMYNDPELKEYGIVADDLSFGFGGFGNNSTRFFHRGPGMGFWHDEDDDNGSRRSFKFGFDLDSLMDQMDHFRGGGPFAFRFGPGNHMDIDSMMSRFDFDGGVFHFNGEDFVSLDSMRQRMMDHFDKMDFDFDFDWDDNDNGFRSFYFGNDDGDPGRVISRVRVFVRSARDADKEKVGADEMEDLQINDISFYPNPSDGRFALELETGNDAPIHIKIVGPDGAVVYEKTSQATDGFYDFDIDISNQREGIYIMQVIQNNSALTKRIIIE